MKLLEIASEQIALRDYMFMGEGTAVLSLISNIKDMIEFEEICQDSIHGFTEQAQQTEWEY